MTTDVICRGSTVVFASTFYDENGNQTDPDSAELTVRVKQYGKLHGPFALAKDDDGVWKYSLSTEGYEPGTFYWCIKAAAVDREIVDQGYFLLQANPANT
jgi:hypothetical protein